MGSVLIVNGNLHLLAFCFQTCHTPMWVKITTFSFYSSSSFFFFLVFCLYRAASAAYGGSQDRGLIRAEAASLHHSHSNTRSKPHLQIRAAFSTYTTAHGNTGSSTHWAGPGIEPATSWFLVGFISAVPRRELLSFYSWCTLWWEKPTRNHAGWSAINSWDLSNEKNI